MTIYASLLAADENSTAGGSSSASHHQQQPQQLQQQQLGVALMKSASWMGLARSDVLMGVNTLVASRLMSQVYCVRPHASCKYTKPAASVSA
jgi:hypothetical protein